MTIRTFLTGYTEGDLIIGLLKLAVAAERQLPPEVIFQEVFSAADPRLSIFRDHCRFPALPYAIDIAPKPVYAR